MEPSTAPAAGTPGPAGEASVDVPVAAPVEPPRQRWRLVLARAAGAPRIAGRELGDAWEETLEGSGLPVHVPAGRVRGRVAFAAPLPLGVVAERELADVFLAELTPIWHVRDALSGRLPDGWSLVDLYDVWLGGPPLAGRVVAAVYRIDVGPVSDPEALSAAARALLDARVLPRTRQKGEGTVEYDLRRLLVDVQVEAGTVVRARTRIHPELGTGRPEEVIAALGELIGTPLDVRAVVRERLVLADDAEEGTWIR